MSYPKEWWVSWFNPQTGRTESASYTQRAAARGAVIMRKAHGMQNVTIKAAGF